MKDELQSMSDELKNERTNIKKEWKQMKQGKGNTVK